MTKINDLSTKDELESSDKFVIWDGATRAITAQNAASYYQSQIAQNFQLADVTLTAIASLQVGPEEYIEATGVDTFRSRKLTVLTYADLTAIPTQSRYDDMLIYVSSRATDGDGGGGYWRFDSGSSATANGSTVLAPDVGFGRWLKNPDTIDIDEITRGDTERQLVKVLRDTPPSIFDYGGVGDGSASDVTALTNALSANRGVYLPLYLENGSTLANWKFDSAITVGSDKLIMGDPRRSKVTQGDARLFSIAGKNITIENLLINADAVTSTGKQTFYMDTATSSSEKIRINNIQWGLERDLTTLVPGYDFLGDANHASNIVVEFQMIDCLVWAPKGNPCVLNDFFASVYFVNTNIDQTRQAAAPTVPAWTVTAGEGLFWENCYVQGVGTGGTGNSAHHGWAVSNAAALGFNRTRSDVVGGRGYTFTSCTGLEMVLPIGSLCGAGGYLFTGCSASVVLGAYAGGRVGLGWAPSAAPGIEISGGLPLAISAPIAINNTGPGILLASSNAHVITNAVIRANGDYGLKETGTSNFNGIVGSHFAGNTTNNALFTGAGSFRSAIMPQSGVPIQWGVGSGAW